jgi:ABC-type glycerol-3-phosphate transport system substrate-binding protein
MKLRVLAVSVLVALVIVCLPSFGSGTQDKAGGGSSKVSKTFTKDNITLTMWTFIDPTATSGRGKVLNDFIKKFQADHPNVKIVTEVQQWTQLLPKQTAAFYAGNAPDIMWNAAEYISGILAIGADEPFEEDIEDVNDGLWGTGVTDGKHYFFDITRSPFGIAYRADLFAKYGISAKSSDYPDLTDFLKALTKVSGKVENGIQLYGWGDSYKTSAPTTGWLCIALGSVGELYHKDGTANFATKTGVQYLEIQKANIDDLKITPSTSLANDYEDVYNDFDAGKYAAIITSSARVATIRKNATFDPMAIQVMSLPKINGKDAKALSGGWCIGVNSKSKYKYEAGKFVELLGGRDADWAFTNESGQVAVRKSTYAGHPDFFQKPENKYITVMKEIMEKNVYAIPPFAAVGTKEDLLTAFSNYYLNKMPAMDALKKAEADFNERNKKK